MRLALAGLVTVLAACKGELNPTYCAVHREDPDCLTTGIPLLDAPGAPECTSDQECAGSPAGPVCDVAGARCVECLVSASCPAMQVCGADHRCYGCTVDADCDSGVCQADNTCALADDVLYASANGSGTACTSIAPCTLQTAVDQLTTTRSVIKLTTAAGTITGDPITIDTPYPVQIIGNGVTFEPSDAEEEEREPAITASGARLDIVGLAILGADADGVRCTNGALSLREVTISDADDFGVRATDCDLVVLRSRLSSNEQGAIYAGSGTHEIVNNIVVDNGDPDALEFGAIQIREATGGRAAFNTVVRTLSRSGGQRVGGIYCTQAANDAFAVAQNIIAAWGDAGRATGPGDPTIRCEFRENVETQTISDVGFTPDFHLSAQSPAGSVRDANTPAMQADCSLMSNVYIDDIDGQARPFNNFCDRGADEYRP